MNISDILQLEEFSLINAVAVDQTIHGLFASDLLSHVMGNAHEGDLLVTMLSNINVLGVASLLDLSGVVFTHNAVVEDAVILKATALGIPLIRTSYSNAEAIIALHKLGV